MNRDPHQLDRSLISYRLVPGAALSAILALAPGILMAKSRSATHPEVVAAKVSLADLDLTTPEGARVAHDRLAAAALRLCNKFGDTRRISNVATIGDCSRDTLNDALRRLNLQLVAAAKETNRR